MGIAAAAAIGAVGAIGGGLIASSGAKSASQAQVQASREAQSAQERMFQQQTQLQEPFRQAGLTAQQQIMYLLGLGSPDDYGAGAQGVKATAYDPSQKYFFADGTAYDPQQGRANAMPGMMGAFGRIGANIAERLGAGAEGMTPEQMVQRGLLYTQAPTTGGARPSGEFGSLAKPFGMDQFEADPGYAFRQSEGMKALERSAAARGNLLSGASMKGIQRFGQDLASQEYQNAFNRYQVERAARLNPLQSLMGAGQSSANTLTGAAGQFGQASAANAMNAGAARASGYVGSANALSSALGGIGQMAMQLPSYQAQNNYYNSLANANQMATYSSLAPSAANTIASNPGIF